MFARIVTAVVGIPLAVFLILYPGGLPFAAAIGLVAALGALEFYGGVRRKGIRPIEWAGTAAAVLLVVWADTCERGPANLTLPAVVTGLLVVCFLVELVRRHRAPVLNVGATVMGAVYVGWLVSYLVMLRGLPGSLVLWGEKLEAGAAFVLYVFVCTWASDTGAFFIGRAYGRTRFAPNLSPNKTVEGSVAAVFCTVLTAAVLGTALRIPAPHALALGLLISVMSQIGDLSESAIKREIGIKDFGVIVPGHGGILDRFDSILFAGPAAYYYVTLFVRTWPG